MDTLPITRFVSIAFGVIWYLILFSAPAYSGDCAGYNRDKAEHFSELAGLKIIDQYGGGQDSRVQIYACSYNSYSSRYSVRIGIYWNGAIFRSNQYNIDGVLTLDGDGGSTEFAETYASKSVGEIRTMRLIAGGIIVLGALASETGDNAIYVTNKCSYDLRLLVRYNYSESNWVTRGWWTIKSGKEKSALSHDGNRISSNNTIIYIYGTNNSGSPKFQGDHSITHSGSTYPAQTFNGSSVPIHMVFCS